MEERIISKKGKIMLTLTGLIVIILMNLIIAPSSYTNDAKKNEVNSFSLGVTPKITINNNPNAIKKNQTNPVANENNSIITDDETESEEESDYYEDYNETYEEETTEEEEYYYDETTDESYEIYGSDSYEEDYYQEYEDQEYEDQEYEETIDNSEIGMNKDDSVIQNNLMGITGNIVFQDNSVKLGIFMIGLTFLLSFLLIGLLAYHIKDYDEKNIKKIRKKKKK